MMDRGARAIPRFLSVAGLLCTLATAAAGSEPRESAGCRFTQIERGRRLERTIEVADAERSYVLDVPETVRPGVPAALLLDFHGFNHSAAGVWNVSGFRALAEQDGFITAYPDGHEVTLHFDGADHTGRGWEISAAADNRDLGFVRTLLERLEAAYCIDRRRIFATGFSNGAFFSSLLGCAMAERFAAIAPVSGGPLSFPCEPVRGVPVLIHHGRQDRLIPPERARQSVEQWVAADRCASSGEEGDCRRHTDCREGAEVVYCEGDFAHRWPLEATGRIWDFFRRHPLP
jgi:polyhydroxybutyrate depolymerase